MSDWLYDGPKEFGGRSDLGLAQLRALDGTLNIHPKGFPTRTKVLPYSKSDNADGSRTIDGNGFRTVTKPAPPPAPVGRILTAGRTQSTSNPTTARLAGSGYGEWKVLPLLVQGNYAAVEGSVDSSATPAGVSQFALGVQHSLFNAAINGSGILPGTSVTQYAFLMVRTTDLDSTSGEVADFTCPVYTIDGPDTTDGALIPVYWPTIQFEGAACYYNDGAGNITQYETITYSKFDTTDLVTPRVIYSDGNIPGTWSYAVTYSYAMHDHLPLGSYQLAPNTLMICHVPFYKQTGYKQYYRALWPTAGMIAAYTFPVPLPLFQISVDCGRTFTPIALDSLFVGGEYSDFLAVGATNGFAIPAFHAQALLGMGVQSLPSAIFFSITLQVPAATSYSWTPTPGVPFSNYWEARLYVAYNNNLASLTRLTVPPGYGTTWGNAPGGLLTSPQAMYPAFACDSPSSGSYWGTIGYVGNVAQYTAGGVSNLTLPDLLFISFDMGTTWQAPRPLPAIARYCGSVQALDGRTLGVAVYVEGSPSSVWLYISRDFGLTWTQEKCIEPLAIELSTNPFSTTVPYELADFDLLTVITPLDGSPPVEQPMSGWLYDSRIPVFNANPTGV